MWPEIPSALIPLLNLPPGESLELGHYDIRYFHGEVEYEEHRETLRHLIRSYLTVFQHLGVETWLAHGTLLGWWWNGRIMPWDFDLDAQVSISTLKYLGENYNRTLHTYEYFDDGDQEAVGNNTYGKDGGGEQQKRSSRPTKSRTYLLDINPASATLERQQGLNVIDARWVDTSNGMFVDITGLAERTPDYSPGVWSCKNYHRYRTRDLFPMRRSEFEGVPATVPYSFEAILREEYGEKSMVATHWQGHHWAPNLKEWVKDLETQ
ncbi:LicD family-domain-containing protein [Lasiosphaeria miniovina]|uniref:LicD family-domain-containing protein n=1 Tax=Lasiosphaeria miniovina TaxID=1954250 RepID=A0AA40DJY3_9PEZI|nr:LicD family-domain-containing protein [Lasiosphaeria miniovina]KAK0706384.1 LicD family-domain-containing protein [Lasiosphaeria miniovina]